jgi:hypothetical protein
VSADFRAMHFCRVNQGELMSVCKSCRYHMCHHCRRKCESWWADYCNDCMRLPEIIAIWEAQPRHHARA